jgi:hypothetical protein
MAEALMPVCGEAKVKAADDQKGEQMALAEGECFQCSLCVAKIKERMVQKAIMAQPQH